MAFLQGLHNRQKSDYLISFSPHFPSVDLGVLRYPSSFLSLSEALSNRGLRQGSLPPPPILWLPPSCFAPIHLWQPAVCKCLMDRRPLCALEPISEAAPNPWGGAKLAEHQPHPSGGPPDGLMPAPLEGHQLCKGGLTPGFLFPGGAPACVNALCLSPPPVRDEGLSRSSH